VSLFKIFIVREVAAGSFINYSFVQVKFQTKVCDKQKFGYIKTGKVANTRPYENWIVNFYVIISKFAI